MHNPTHSTGFTPLYPQVCEYRNVECDDVREMFAVRTPEELRAVLDRIDGKGRGLPVEQRMLRDAHCLTEPEAPLT